MKIRQIVRQCSLAFVLAIGMYLLVLMLGILLPSDSKITASLRSAVQQGLLTDDIILRPSDFGQFGHSFDMFSECVGLTTNLGTGDRPILYRVLASPFVSSDTSKPAGVVGSQPCGDLVQAVEDHPKANLTYLRFWHGYQVYMRVVLTIAGLGKLRVFNAVILYGCLLYLCFRLEGWFGWLAVPIFLLPYALQSDLLSAPLVTVQALPLAWSYLSVAIFMQQLEKSHKASNSLFVFTFLSGSIYNFISMLFTPQLIPALMAFMMLAAYVRWDGDRSRRLLALLQAGCLALVWFLGFGLTWIAKWAISASYLGVAAVRDSVAPAASGMHYLSHDNPRYHRLFGATSLLLQPWLVRTLVLELVMVAAIIYFRRSPNGARRSVQARNWAFLLSPMLIVLTWTEVMHFHSAEHPTFAYRAMLLAIIFPLLALLLVRREDVTLEATSPSSC
jgi:hypothetical protein